MKVTVEELLAAHRFFAGLSAETVALVAGCSRNVAISPGTLMIEEGVVADTFYVLRRGHVSIDVHAPGRGAEVIETVGPGSVVGWSWLVPPYRWTFDARAIDDVGAVAVDGACLRAKALADPQFGFALVSRVSSELLGRLQATRLRLLDLYRGPRDE
ncbi:MAG: cyclic nucleotide-binding domain-containing protein [Acidimicrobiales bacterium]